MSASGVVVNVCDDHSAADTVWWRQGVTVRPSRAAVRPGRCEAEREGIACRNLATRTERVTY